MYLPGVGDLSGAGGLSSLLGGKGAAPTPPGNLVDASGIGLQGVAAPPPIAAAAQDPGVQGNLMYADPYGNDVSGAVRDALRRQAMQTMGLSLLGHYNMAALPAAMQAAQQQYQQGMQTAYTVADKRSTGEEQNALRLAQIASDQRRDDIARAKEADVKAKEASDNTSVEAMRKQLSQTNPSAAFADADTVKAAYRKMLEEQVTPPAQHYHEVTIGNTVYAVDNNDPTKKQALGPAHEDTAAAGTWQIVPGDPGQPIMEHNDKSGATRPVAGLSPRQPTDEKLLTNEQVLAQVMHASSQPGGPSVDEALMNIPPEMLPPLWKQKYDAAKAKSSSFVGARGSFVAPIGGAASAPSAAKSATSINGGVTTGTGSGESVTLSGGRSVPLSQLVDAVASEGSAASATKKLKSQGIPDATIRLIVGMAGLH